MNGSNPEPLKSPPFMLRYLSTNGGDFSGAILNLMAVMPSARATITHHTGLPSKEGVPRLIRVDFHGAKEIPTGTCHAILKAAGIKKH